MYKCTLLEIHSRDNHRPTDQLNTSTRVCIYIYTYILHSCIFFTLPFHLLPLGVYNIIQLVLLNMPFCEVGKYQDPADAAGNNGIKIFYKTYGRGPVKVLLIIGNFLSIFYL